MTHRFFHQSAEPFAEPQPIGTTTSRNLPKALVLKADQLWGKGGYSLRRDRSLAGGYAVCNNGETLSIGI